MLQLQSSQIRCSVPDCIVKIRKLKQHKNSWSAIVPFSFKAILPKFDLKPQPRSWNRTQLEIICFKIAAPPSLIQRLARLKWIWPIRSRFLNSICRIYHAGWLSIFPSAWLSSFCEQQSQTIDRCCRFAGWLSLYRGARHPDRDRHSAWQSRPDFLSANSLRLKRLYLLDLEVSINGGECRKSQAFSE